MFCHDIQNCVKMLLEYGVNGFLYIYLLISLIFRRITTSHVAENKK